MVVGIVHILSYLSKCSTTENLYRTVNDISEMRYGYNDSNRVRSLHVYALKTKISYYHIVNEKFR